MRSFSRLLTQSSPRPPIVAVGRWGALPIAGVLLACTAAPSTPTLPFGFDGAALLAEVADHAILPELRAFSEATQALRTRTADYAAASRGASVEEAETGAGEAAIAARDAARDAWRVTMRQWQKLEVMQVGPAGSPGVFLGGLGLRDELYSWPTVHPCAIDQQLVANSFRADGYFGAKLVTTYGLDALEYVLFADSPDNACPAAATLNREGQWAALPEAELRQRRADYAEAVAQQLAEDARVLLQTWSAEGENFRRRFVEAGAADSPYRSPADAINQLFAALYYIELQVKDRKLAVPAGLHVDCVQEVCPEQLESPFAHFARESIAANLEGFTALFFGGPEALGKLGFDDYLIAAGAPALVDEMRLRLQAAQEAVAADDRPLHRALVEDPASVVTLHEAIKALTDLMKSQMVTTLNLDVPQEGAGDND